MAYIAKLTNAGGVSTLTRYVDMLAGNAAFVDGSYESIATLTGNGSASVLTFSSIPQTYTHLQLRFISRVNSANYALLSFNGNTSTASYTWHELSGDGSTAGTGAVGTGVFPGVVINHTSAGDAASGIYGAAIVDILDYTNTNKYKTTRSVNGVDKNGSGQIDLDSSLWLSTAAINSLSITFNGGFAIASGSHFALYGMKG